MTSFDDLVTAAQQQRDHEDEQQARRSAADTEHESRVVADLTALVRDAVAHLSRAQVPTVPVVELQAGAWRTKAVEVDRAWSLRHGTLTLSGQLVLEGRTSVRDLIAKDPDPQRARDLHRALRKSGLGERDLLVLAPLRPALTIGRGTYAGGSPVIELWGGTLDYLPVNDGSLSLTLVDDRHALDQPARLHQLVARDVADLVSQG